MGERITEDEVRRRMVAAASDSDRWRQRPYSQRQIIGRWLNKPPGSVYRRYPAALKAVGVRWVEDHYEEAP